MNSSRRREREKLFLILVGFLPWQPFNSVAWLCAIALLVLVFKKPCWGPVSLAHEEGCFLHDFPEGSVDMPRGGDPFHFVAFSVNCMFSTHLP